MKGQDWYEDQLDRDDLDPETRRRYEAEADRLAAGITRQQEVAIARQRAARARAAQIRALLTANDDNVVDLFGLEEFGQDYSCDVDGRGTWHITSSVARSDQPNSWSFEDEASARRHLHKLIWDRMYYRYVRLGKIDNLNELPDFV